MDELTTQAKGAKKGKKPADGEKLLGDSRFADLFTDKDFVRDKYSEAYK